MCFLKDGDFLFKKRRFLAQNTKKVDCAAQIKLREVILFPDYKVERSYLLLNRAQRPYKINGVN